MVGSGLKPLTSTLLLTGTLNTDPSLAGEFGVCPQAGVWCACARPEGVHTGVCKAAWALVVPTCGWRWAWLWSSGEKENRSGSQRRWSPFPSG